MTNAPKELKRRNVDSILDTQQNCTDALPSGTITGLKIMVVQICITAYFKVKRSSCLYATKKKLLCVCLVVCTDNSETAETP